MSFLFPREIQSPVSPGLTECYEDYIILEGISSAVTVFSPLHCSTIEPIRASMLSKFYPLVTRISGI